MFTWAVNQGAGSGDSLLERGQPGMILERVSRGDQPPDRIKRQTAQAFARDEAMTLMGWVEASPEQPDAHAR